MGDIPTNSIVWCSSSINVLNAEHVSQVISIIRKNNSDLNIVYGVDYHKHFDKNKIYVFALLTAPIKKEE